MGVDVDGAFAEYGRAARLDTRLRPAPVDPPTLAVLTDAVATPYHALVKIAAAASQARRSPSGIGGLGSNAVQLGKHLGAGRRDQSERRTSSKLAHADSAPTR